MFTYNNPPETLLNFVPHSAIIYAVYQLEVGESGTPHWQGFFISTVRKNNSVWNVEVFHNKARIKPCNRGMRAYCMKEDTRQDGYWEYGTFPESQQGKRNDLTDARDFIKEGGTMRELYEQFPQVVARYELALIEGVVGSVLIILKSAVERQY